MFYCLKSLDEIHKNSIRYKQDNYINFSVFITSLYCVLYYTYYAKFIVVNLNEMLARIG